MSSLTLFQRKKTPEISKFTLFSALPDSFSVRFLAYYLHFAPFCLSILVANSYFSTPKYPLFIPKILLFNDYFALSGHVFHGSKRGCLYNYCECLCFSPCVWQHFTLHLAPFYLAFSTKTHCIQHQNTLHLAAYCIAFSTKMHYIQRKIAPKQVQMTVVLNKNSFCPHRLFTPFCIQTNLRENRFFAAWLEIGG